MQARVVDAIEGAGPGAVEHRHIEGRVRGVAITCPRCGEETWIPFNMYGNAAGWTLVQEEPLTLSPSLHHEVPDCGWHGYLRDGEFVTV